MKGTSSLLLRQSNVRSTLTLQIPLQSEWPKLSKQKARPHRPERTAQVALRYQQVDLRPPPDQKDKAVIKLWMVHICEETPPPGEKPLEWFLLNHPRRHQQPGCVRMYTLVSVVLAY